MCFLWALHIQSAACCVGGPPSAWPGPAAPPGFGATQKTTLAVASFQVQFILNHTSDAGEDNFTQLSWWPSLVAHAESSKKALAMVWATFSTLFSFASGPASSRASLTQYCSVLGR